MKRNVCNDNLTIKNFTGWKRAIIHEVQVRNLYCQQPELSHFYKLFKTVLKSAIELRMISKQRKTKNAKHVYFLTQR